MYPPEFPFLRMRVGEYLFIPCIDLVGVTHAGHKAAAAQQVRVTAVHCIYGGMLGVMFRLR